MTPQEMKLRITECGPNITDQQRLIICIEHYEILKTRASKSLGHLKKDDLPYVHNCALCDKYGGPNKKCTRDGVACLFGLYGCLDFYSSVILEIGFKDHTHFIAAVDDMLTFLRSHLEDETV